MSVFQDKEYREKHYEVVERLKRRKQADNVMENLKTVWWWVKNMDFEFLDISQEVSTILYWLSSDECVGKTDFQISEEQRLVTNKDLFCEVCRGSDQYVLDNPKKGLYQTYTFIELLMSSKWEKHIWRTVKSIVPPQEGQGHYIRGQAEFLDRTIGNYNNALEVLKDSKLTKLNDNLYVYC